MADKQSPTAQTPSLPPDARRYWEWVVSAPTQRQIFELLMERGEMYITQIARVLGKSNHMVVADAISRLERAGVVRREKRGRVYIQLQPGAAEQYQQLLPTLKLDKPVHIRIFELICERGRLSEVQIASTLYIAASRVSSEVAPMVLFGVVTKGFEQGIPFAFYEIVPDKIEAYKQLYDAQQEQTS